MSEVPQVPLITNDLDHMKTEVNEQAHPREGAIKSYMFSIGEYLSKILEPGEESEFQAMNEQMTGENRIPAWAREVLSIFTTRVDAIQGMGDNISASYTDEDNTVRKFDIRWNEGSLDPSQDAPGEIHFHAFQDRIQLNGEDGRFPNEDEMISLHLRAPSNDTPAEQRKLQLSITKGQGNFEFEYPPKIK